jgi:hypothetical protein
MSSLIKNKKNENEIENRFVKRSIPIPSMLEIEIDSCIMQVLSSFKKNFQTVSNIMLILRESLDLDIHDPIFIPSNVNTSNYNYVNKKTEDLTRDEMFKFLVKYNR